MTMKLYFGHPVSTYDTDVEEYLLRVIQEEFPGWVIENPNNAEHAANYQLWKEEKGNGMLYFTEVVLPGCMGGIFLPFEDGSYGTGVAKEMFYFVTEGLPVWKISHRGNIYRMHSLEFAKVLTVDETRARLVGHR